MCELKKLPVGCSKKELKAMFPNQSVKRLMTWCNEIQRIHRRGKCGKKNMLPEEMAELFAEYTGVPLGYTNTFQTGETYTDVYLRSQRRLMMIELKKSTYIPPR